MTIRNETCFEAYLNNLMLTHNFFCYRLVCYYSYKKNVELTSKRFLDRPQSPVDTAVWWTEYVLRQEDTSFMKPLGVNLSWYQIRLLDVWAFFATIIGVFLYITFKIAKFIIKSLFNGNSGKGHVNKKKVKKN